MKVYHMIIGKKYAEQMGDTSTRREYQSYNDAFYAWNEENKQ